MTTSISVTKEAWRQAGGKENFPDHPHLMEWDRQRLGLGRRGVGWIRACTHDPRTSDKKSQTLHIARSI